jgi:hypothetical protein
MSEIRIGQTVTLEAHNGNLWPHLVGVRAKVCNVRLSFQNAQFQAFRFDNYLLQFDVPIKFNPKSETTYARAYFAGGFVKEAWASSAAEG